jgi:hypothetical protein
MKHYQYAVLALAGLFFGPVAARAVNLSLLFSYEDPNGRVSGDFTLMATAVAGDPGAYLATGGTLDLTAPAADGIAGDYTLVPNPDAPNSLSSATGLFIYDDLVMPGSNPVVTNPGLLAFGGPGLGDVPEGKGTEINLFSSGPNTYDLYTGANGSYPYSYVFTTPQGSITASVPTPLSGSSRQLIAAPEPSMWVITGSFLVIALRAARRRERVPRVIGPHLGVDGTVQFYELLPHPAPVRMREGVN